jgi:hypothetical protein
MKRFVYNTQGTGISHRQIDRLERTQPGSGTYLGSDMSSHPLGDEIMLLDGFSDPDALQGMGYVGSGNYKTIDYNAFSVSPVSRPSAGAPSQRRRADLYVGPNFYPFDGAETYPDTPAPATFFNGARLETLGQSYEHWSQTPKPGTWLNGLGDAAGDRRAAVAAATVSRDFCRLGCNAAEMAFEDRRRCNAACDGLYSAAMAIIDGALPPGGSTPADPEQASLIEAKLRSLERGAEQAAAGEDVTGEEEETGMSTTTMALIGAGVLGVGLIAVLALRK